MKKTLALILCMAMLLPTITSCSEGSENAQEDTSSEVTSEAVTETVDETEAEEEETLYTADVPEGTDYGGADFTVLTYPDDGTIWGDVDWNATELTGEGLNDAVYYRTQKTNDQLGINIQTAYMSASNDTSLLENSVTAGDDAYQLATVYMQGSFTVAQNGRVHELNKFASNGTLQLDAPWWDGNILSDLSINGKNFCLTGDIGTMYKKSIGAIMFNKYITETNGLEDPYALMNEGKWTVDAMVEMGTKVSNDIDGDGEMTQEDQYGLICFCDMIALAMIGCDVNYVSKDENDTPYDSFMSEKTVSVIEKLATLMYNPDITYSWSKAGVGEDPAFTMYQTDKSLFYYGELHAVATMRDMEHDFGILPMPKYDETQEGYHHCVNPNVAATYTIPVTNTKYEMTGYVMDTLGANSKNELTPAYYDVMLRGKVSRDEESQTSLDIIIGTIRYDVGYLAGFGYSSMLYTMADSYDTDISSKYAKQGKVISKTMERMLSKFDDIE